MYLEFLVDIVSDRQESSMNTMHEEAEFLG